jgi:hypothetical protein
MATANSELLMSGIPLHKWTSAVRSVALPMAVRPPSAAITSTIDGAGPTWVSDA